MHDALLTDAVQDAARASIDNPMLSSMTLRGRIMYLWLSSEPTAILRCLQNCAGNTRTYLRRRLLMRVLLASAVRWLSRHDTQRLRNSAKDQSAGQLGESADKLSRPSASIAEVYRTAHGVPVCDKRYSRGRIKDPEQPPARVGGSGGDTRTRPRDGNSRLDSACGFVSKSLTLAAVPNLSTATLTSLLKTDLAARAVILGSASGEAELVKFIDLAANPSAGDWRQAVHRWLVRNGAVTDLATIVSTEILDPKVESGTGRRMSTLMRLVPRVASALPEDVARQVLEKTVEIATSDIDPYGANGASIAARNAAVSLLRQRPELNQAFTEVLQRYRSETGERATAPARLAALALRERGVPGAALLAEIARTSGASREQLESLATLADAPLANVSSLTTAYDVDSFFDRLTRYLRGLSWPLIILSVGSIGYIVYLTPQKSIPTSVKPLTVTLQIAIAALAVLATTHVFAVNFAANRLPGIIGRYVSRSWTLTATYTASTILIALAVWQPTGERLLRSCAWMWTAAVVIWGICLIATLRTVLSRSDSARAAAGFVSWQLARARTSGKRFGKYQARTFELNNLVTSAPNIELKVGAWRDQWDSALRSRRRGVLAPTNRNLRRLITQPEFKAGARLRFVAGFGLIIGKDQDIAHLVPTRATEISERLKKNALKRLKVRDSLDIEELSSGAVSLTKLSTDLAASGDTGTAHAVAHSLTKLLKEHISAVRRARRNHLRRWMLREQVQEGAGSDLPGYRGIAERSFAARSAQRDEDVAPVIPAVRDVVHSAIQFALERDLPLFNVAESIVRPVMNESGDADGTVSLVAAALSDADKISESGLDSALALLQVAGHRAIELRSRTMTDFILGDLINLCKKDPLRGRAIETLSLLSAFASRHDTVLARRCCESLGKELAEVGKFSAAMTLWRVGAAGVCAGALSVAVQAAHFIDQMELHDHIQQVNANSGLRGAEAIRADIFGGYLGSAPEDALNAFAMFLASVRPIVAGS
jgi:hypothetical protein